MGRSNGLPVSDSPLSPSIPCSGPSANDAWQAVAVHGKRVLSLGEITVNTKNTLEPDSRTSGRVSEIEHFFSSDGFGRIMVGSDLSSKREHTWSCTSSHAEWTACDRLDTEVCMAPRSKADVIITVYPVASAVLDRRGEIAEYTGDELGRLILIDDCCLPLSLVEILETWRVAICTSVSSAIPQRLALSRTIRCWLIAIGMRCC